MPEVMSKKIARTLAQTSLTSSVVALRGNQSQVPESTSKSLEEVQAQMPEVTSKKMEGSQI